LSDVVTIEVGKSALIIATAAMTLITSLATAFLAWLAKQVVSQGAKLVQLEARMKERENACGERLDWIRAMESAVNETAQKVAEMHGVMLGRADKQKESRKKGIGE
jgi:hypothetical protein